MNLGAAISVNLSFIRHDDTASPAPDVLAQSQSPVQSGDPLDPNNVVCNVCGTVWGDGNGGQNNISAGVTVTTSASSNSGNSVNNYVDFVSTYAINPGPYAAALLGGLWPKSWAPATNFRPPLLGSTNPLTSVPRAFGLPGADSALVQIGAAGIGLVTVGIGFYDLTIEYEGLYYMNSPPAEFYDSPASFLAY